jgi:hypothetical protein
VAALALLGAAVAAAPAAASCGAEKCVLDLFGPEMSLKPYSLEISYQSVDQDDVRVGTDPGTVGEIPSTHNEIATQTQSWNVNGRARVSEWLAFSATLPFLDRMHRHEHEHHPGFYEVQEWNYSGVGDLMVTGSLTPGGQPAPGRTSVALQLGVKAPTGKTEVEEVDGDQPEPPARPGTGSWDGVAGVQVRRPFGTRTLDGDAIPMTFSIGVLGRVNGTGTEDYRIGNEFQVNAAGGWALTTQVALLAQVNSVWRAKDDVGETDSDPDNTGGTAVYATPGMMVNVGPALAVYGYAQVRLYERVNGIQITAPFHLMIGTRYGF